MSDEPIPLLPAQAQLHNAIRWLEDTANIGNANAALIHRVLQATLLEDAKIKGCLVMNLAPLLQTTVGKSVPKFDIIQALMPIRHLLGGPPPPQAGPPPILEN